jgi:Alcohol dehydrogenase GroES-like domain
VSSCGVCRTDLHVVDAELPGIKYPIVPGHEIVGRVDLIGSNPDLAPSAFLIGRLGSSAFRLSAPSVLMSLARARASLRNRHQGPSIIDIGADKITATFAADLRAAIQPKVCSNMKETLGWSGFRLT